jgi:hypothetical protein
LPFGLKGHAIRGENLRNLYIWFKSPKWDFWFPRSWKKRGFFGGQKFTILLKEVPATLSRNFLDIFSKRSPHFQEEIYEMAKLLGNNNNSWQIWLYSVVCIGGGILQA